MIRFLFTLIIVGVLVFLGATVKLGKRTFFGHIQAIWKTEEVQELKKGVEEKAGPTVEKVKRGVKAGVDEYDKESGSGSGSAHRDAGPDAVPATP
jgi:hypothetical protein